MTTVIAVRIPKNLKKALDELGIDYAEEIRHFLRERVRREKMKRMLNKIRELRRKGPKLKGNLAAEFIREDRDTR